MITTEQVTALWSQTMGEVYPFPHDGAHPLHWFAMANPHELSQAAHDRLAAELQELRTHGRIELADRIERAREHGDLRENAEYHAAKEEKAKMEARIAKIAGILENAVILGDGDSHEVVVGSVVHLRYEGDDPDEIEKYLVGSIEERHDDLHVVSPTSPLGERLLGKVVGDVVTYAAPNGELTVEVVLVE
jgi:transcription elongation factor GreA